MMYNFLLPLHSLVRWLVLISIVFALVRAYRGWLAKQVYTASDNRVRAIMVNVLHIQLLIGLWLYAISPIVSYFLHNFGKAVRMRDIRFFGMEHVTMMLLAIILITIGMAKVKRKVTDHDKFRTQAIWLTIGLLIILSSVPWAFSPLISRPWFRAF